MEYFQKQLAYLKSMNQYRSIPYLTHHGRYIERDNQRMLNMSSNDYLGLASNESLQRVFFSNMVRTCLR
ncbi:8-amino-7-oxononanoate synthase [Rodentibacter pneumotropicus]|uniref:8-amino-7-oxononanoate synthase n=1 Tax=Rodentibacter pneumotropicus TaxID=758 RepID=A0A3S4U723_9PAST|nr:8-amino-7-oxononanoate synthase [Rodentibacter pneumotropicus]